MHAVVGPLDPLNQERYPFRIELELRGMESLHFAPVAGDTRVVMDGAWSHPSFVGRFLPVEHEIAEDRFTAEWRVSGLAGVDWYQLGQHFKSPKAAVGPPASK